MTLDSRRFYHQAPFSYKLPHTLNIPINASPTTNTPPSDKLLAGPAPLKFPAASLFPVHPKLISDFFRHSYVAFSATISLATQYWKQGLPSP